MIKSLPQISGDGKLKAGEADEFLSGELAFQSTSASASDDLPLSLAGDEVDAVVYKALPTKAQLAGASSALSVASSGASGGKSDGGRSGHSLWLLI